jgi:2-polyprenyl-3-methyl-5-hydroxy-6-metoxy-1,4-benzoquinol methylase/uncharacterized protein YbaR (Trm112 family)
MKRRLLDVIACPVCRGSLEVTVFEESQQTVAIPLRGPVCRESCGLKSLRLRDARTTNRAPNDADCTACYRREIEEGILACSACGALYPIIAAVPRLVRGAEQEYASFFDRHRNAVRKLAGRDPLPQAAVARDAAVFDPRSNESFGLQWTNQAEGDKTWFKDDSSLRKDEFLYSLAVDRDELRGALILDGGCGNGRLTSSLASFGAEIVGVELSAGIERAQSGRDHYAGAHAPLVHFAQGNVMELPLRRGCFDIVHSSGVLHHTPSVERALAGLLPALRPGGRVYVQLYRRRQPWVGIPNALLRSLTSRLPPRLLYRMCWVAVPLHTALVLGVAKLRGEKSPIASASRGERALSLFDNFSPRYQYRFSADEMRHMFEAAGLVDIRDTTLANEARHMVAFTARTQSRAVTRSGMT